MRTALLIPFTNDRKKEEGYVWMTPSERIVSRDFATREEALANRPDQNIYVCRDCDNNWELIK